MSHLPIQPLQAAMLFENAAQFSAQFPEWNDILNAINESLENRTAPFEIMPGATGNDMATLSNGDMHITLERMNKPLGYEGFAPVLSQPYYANMKPELITGVQKHRCAILVNVGLGSIPFPVEHEVISELGMTDQLTGGQNQEKFELRMLLTQIATLAFYQHFTPTVVHWGQSDQLFDGTTYQGLASIGFALPLYVHPGFGSSGKKIKRSYCTGVNAYGTRHLIGKHVQFIEHPQPMAKSYEQVLAFVAYCRNLGHIIEDGGTFSIGEDGDVIEVHHMAPTDVHPDGYIELRLRDGATGRKMKFKVRPNAKGVMDAFLGKRNALSGKDAPDRKAAMSRKTGAVSDFAWSLFTKVAALGVIYVLITSGTGVMQLKLFGGGGSSGFIAVSELTQQGEVKNLIEPPRAISSRPVQNNLNSAQRSAPGLFQPELPDR